MNINIQSWDIPKNQLARDAALQALFPNASRQKYSALTPPFRGGRAQALEKLQQVQAAQYARSRNYLDGSVTHLSPYLRHGCVSLNEAVASVRARFGLSAEKLLFEFGWREYWRNVWYQQGNNIFSEMAAPKVLLEYQPLPADAGSASTGLPCMDAFIRQLADTGYLHNHARMWLAAYLVHWRKADWKQCADWMHDQLLDGDYASNHLSWQWIASSFSHKPYFFNQENLAKYTQQQYCDKCQAECPFRDSYSNLEQRLFQATEQAPRQDVLLKTKPVKQAEGDNTIIWLHDEMLNPEHPLLALPHAKVFIFDPDYYQNWSLLRLQFMADCLAEMPGVQIWIGDTAEVFRHLNAGQLFTQNSPNLKLKDLVRAFSVTWQPEHMVCAASMAPQTLSSFSRFWKVAKPDFIGSE